MNQALADLFLSLPPALRAPAVFGAVCLTLDWLGFWLWIHLPLDRVVRTHYGETAFRRKMPRPWHRILYGAARDKLATDGLFVANRVLLSLLAAASAVVGVCLFLPAIPWLDITSRALLTLTLGLSGALYLGYQPSTTLERRVRWGFGKANAVVHAALWEVLITAVVFLWLYDAWFLPAFVAV